MKILWFDCETTGLDPKLNDIVTISIRIEVDGEIKDKLDLKIQPRNWEAISPQALATNGLTVEEMKTFEQPMIAYNKIVALFDKYVDKYKKNKTTEDKLIPAGYNVVFDILFLAEFFLKSGNKYFGAYVDYHKLDVASIVLWMKLNKLFDCQGFKLVEVAKTLEIAMDNAHDAGCDIDATRIVLQKLNDRLKTVYSSGAQG